MCQRDIGMLTANDITILGESGIKALTLMEMVKVNYLRQTERYKLVEEASR